MDISTAFCFAATIIPSFLFGWSVGIGNHNKSNIEVEDIEYVDVESNISNLIPDEVISSDWKK